MPWHALCVESGYDIGRRQAREITIADELRASLGNDAVLVPIQRVIKRVTLKTGRVDEQERFRTLMPNYVFCREPYPAHRKVRGCLMLGDRPYPIPDIQVARMMTAAQVTHQEGEPEKTYAIGDVVQITGCALPVFISKIEGDKLVGAIELFGKVSEVRFGKERVAA